MSKLTKPATAADSVYFMILGLVIWTIYQVV